MAVTATETAVPTQPELLRRYVLLYAVFGLFLGLRYGADAWVFELLSGWAEGEHLLMALAMAGMLFGEFLGGRLTDRTARPDPVGRRAAAPLAVLVGAAAYGLSSVADVGAMTAGVVWPMYVGAVGFGVGLGVQHSSLDAWFSNAIELSARDGTADVKEATDAQFAWGFTAYTAGFFVGQALAFPLLYDFEWARSIADRDPQTKAWVPLAYSASPLLYALATALSLLPFLIRPQRVVGRPESKADDATRGYLGVLRAGGVPFFMIVLVGAGVSFLIQHIDSFAATDLLSNAATVGAKAQSLGTLHLTAAVWVGAVAWTLDRSERYKTLSPRERVGFLGVNLLVVLLTLGGGSLTSATGAVPVVVAVLVGCGHALLNTLPQVVKWAVLDTAGRADKGTASAVLGYAKRVPNLILSLAILSRTGGRPSDEVMYGLLVIVTAVSLLALLAYSFTIRRHRLVILLAPEHLDAVRTAIGRAVYLERNLTVRFSPPGAPQGQTDAALVRLRVRLYTSGDKRAFVRGLTNTIRGMPGTDSVAPE